MRLRLANVNPITYSQPYLVALKLEADVFELVGCHKGDCSVSQVDYSCAAIWHKIMGSWSLAKAGEAGGVGSKLVLHQFHSCKIY